MARSRRRPETNAFGCVRFLHPTLGFRSELVDRPPPQIRGICSIVYHPCLKAPYWLGSLDLGLLSGDLIRLGDGRMRRFVPQAALGNELAGDGEATAKPEGPNLKIKS